VSNDPTDTERRTVLKALGVSSAAGLAGVLAPRDQSEAGQDDGGRVLESVPVARPLYDDQRISVIPMAVSTEDLAGQIREAVGYATQFVPRNAEVVDIEDLSALFFVTNGVEGGGPNGNQFPVFDSVPTDDDYTSLRNPRQVVWSDDAEPRRLTSAAAIQSASEAGELSIRSTEMVLNTPVVEWPGMDASSSTTTGGSS